MELEYSPDGIILDKELNQLDEFVLNFTRILDEQGIRYCLISGYVVILFGRSRSTEDVDIFIERIDEPGFLRLWEALMADFECIITSDPMDAFNTYLKDGLALRFSRQGAFIPNMEMKFPKKEIDTWTLQKRKKVLLNGNLLWISPMEIQIPFKLWLGSDKDIEDALHLHHVFQDKLDMSVMEHFLEELQLTEVYRRIFIEKRF